MLYVRIELWPWGNRSKSRLLHEGIIRNTGEGDLSNGEYRALLSNKGGFKRDDDKLARFDVKNVLRETNIAGFPRLRLNAWILLERVLRAAFDVEGDESE